MDRENLASIITRLHFCNKSKLENIEEWLFMKNYLLNLDENEFDKKLREYGVLDKEAS